jgi:hypothetical protein
VDILLDLEDHFVGNPLEVRNNLTVDALIPKFMFSGIDPIRFAIFALSSFATHHANDVSVFVVNGATAAVFLYRCIHRKLA